MRVLLVTTWNTPCGIAEHSFYLKQAVEAADPSIEIVPEPLALDPTALSIDLRKGGIDLIHLNYHAALHSRWTPDWIRNFQAVGLQVLVTYHDTGVPNSDQCKQIAYVLRPRLDAMVVHEPFDDLPIEKTHYWRMGVPGWTGEDVYDWSPRSWCARRPILGSIGFPFGWKNYDQLARVTAEVDWALLLIAPTATPEQIAAWRAINPHLLVHPEFLHRDRALVCLAGCDATAFMYVCHNTGQSGAILQGIAARKPVIALATCRQFRALYEDRLGQEAITWVDTFEDLAIALRWRVPIARVDPGIVALAHQDGWAQLGTRYASLYHALGKGA